MNGSIEQTQDGEPFALEVPLAIEHETGAGAITQAVMDDLRRHTKGAAQSDDITLVVLKRAP